MPYQPEPITWQFDPETPEVARYQQSALEFAVDHLAANFPAALDSLQRALGEQATDARIDRYAPDDAPDGYDALLNLLVASR